jgi:glutamate dehydrogenase (NAD(P)+)
VQDAQRFFWKATDIHERLNDLMTSAFQRTLHFATTKGISMRMAALIIGIDRVAKAHLHRGLYP